MKEHFDIAIIGAGPAGATCALALRDSGLSVVIIDKAKFPRDKICGDAVGGRVKNVLKELGNGLLEDLEKYEAKNDSIGWKLFAPNRKAIEVDFVNSGYISRRIDFDNWLFDKVKDQANIDIIENEEVKELKYSTEKVEILLKDNREITASLVIGCDGAHSVVAKHLSEKRSKIDHKHYSGAVRAYYKNIEGTVNSNKLEIHLVRGFLPGYFWIFPLNNGLSNVGFGMLSKDIKERRIDLKSALKEIINSSVHLKRRFGKAELIDNVKGFGLPLGGKRRSISGNRYMLCGDAASLIDPLTGEGIGNSMLSGLYAARQAVRCFKKEDFTVNEIKHYDDTVYKKLLPELKKNLLLQHTFNRPWLINALVNIADKNPKFKSWFAKRI